MKQMLKHRYSVAVLAALLMFALALPAALADSPHFIRGSASFSGNNLAVTFKEAGLGNNVTVVEQATADATAVYACINGGGNHPKAANKETVSGPVSASGAFTSGKNGSINGTLFLSPPGPGSFSCPSGQTLVLASVSYTNVRVTDLTNGDFLDIPGTFSKTFFTF